MMALRKILILGAFAITIGSVACGTARATWVVIDDFDSLELGAIDDQDGWQASEPTSAVVLDPDDPDHQVLSVITESTIVRHSALIPDGETRTLFLRFRYDDQLSVSFGLSDYLSPSQFGDFEAELSLTSTRDDLRINDGGTYEVLTTLEPARWYNCWLHIDNIADVTSVWIHDRDDEDATAADQLSIDGRTEIQFRSASSHGLQTFFIKTGGGSGVAGPLLLDDIHIQTGDDLDLTYPSNIMSDIASTPGRIRLDGAWPNPCNPRTAISFTLEETQSIELAVYDLYGRLVRLLDAGVREAGSHSVPWDGRDQTGANAASGVYLVRLNGQRETETGKLVLAR